MQDEVAVQALALTWTLLESPTDALQLWLTCKNVGNLCRNAEGSPRNGAFSRIDWCKFRERTNVNILWAFTRVAEQNSCELCCKQFPCLDCPLLLARAIGRLETLRCDIYRTLSRNNPQRHFLIETDLQLLGLSVWHQTELRWLDAHRKFVLLYELHTIFSLTLSLDQVWYVYPLRLRTLLLEEMHFQSCVFRNCDWQKLQEDVGIIMDQTGCEFESSLVSFFKYKGDIVEAIMDLTL